MDSYFTIKLWIQFYIPLIILACCALVVAFIWILAWISDIVEKILKRGKDGDE